MLKLSATVHSFLAECSIAELVLFISHYHSGSIFYQFFDFLRKSWNPGWWIQDSRCCHCTSCGVIRCQNQLKRTGNVLGEYRPEVFPVRISLHLVRIKKKRPKADIFPVRSRARLINMRFTTGLKLFRKNLTNMDCKDTVNVKPPIVIEN